MRVFTRLSWRVPEGTHYKALKAEAEVIDGNVNDLLWDLAIHRYALQKVVDALWDLDELPKRSQLHQLFYPMLRQYGFRAHVARNIYDSALAIVKSARSNGGKKPQVRRFSARLDYVDARVELDKGIVRIIIRDEWYTLRLRHRREYIEKFLGLRWKEVHVKYESKRLFVSIVFETKYQPYAPRGFMAIDVNLKTIATFNGYEVRRYRTRFTDALSKRAMAEELQGKYPKRWRYNKRILNRVRALHRRARNIINDSSWKLAKEIVTRACRRKHAIVLEDLEHLRESINDKGNTIRWKLTLFAYRKLQQSIIAKAIEYGVPIVIVDPRGTSITCPRCGSRLTYIHRLAFCGNCGFTADRDVVGAMNIWLRAVQAYAGLPGSTQSASPMNNETRERGGKQNEEMKKTNKNNKQT